VRGRARHHGPGGGRLRAEQAARRYTGSLIIARQRIDPAAVKQHVIAAGFKLDSTSGLLRNTNDAHLLQICVPAIRGRTVQLVFTFRKPKPV
jgi:predicted methyltransferase